MKKRKKVAMKEKKEMKRKKEKHISIHIS